VKRFEAIAMKRLNSNSAVSKLGESAYNALVMTNQVNGDEKRILHYSYNLSGQEEHPCSIDEETGYGALTRSNSLFGSQRITRRAFSKEEKQSKHFFEKGLQRSNSIGHLPYNREAQKSSSRQNTRGKLIFFGGETQGCAREKSSTDAGTSTDTPVTKNNGTRETHTRKYGLGETTNVSLMSHKLRKKAVCDSTDNSHYQRQFLRVLNKRF